MINKCFPGWLPYSGRYTGGADWSSVAGAASHIVGTRHCDGKCDGFIERAVRRALNPISTRRTMLMQRAGPRGPAPSARRGPRGPGHLGVSPLIRPTPTADVAVPNVVGLRWDNVRESLHRVGLESSRPGSRRAAARTAGLAQWCRLDQHPGSRALLPTGSPVRLGRRARTPALQADASVMRSMLHEPAGEAKGLTAAP